MNANIIANHLSYQHRGGELEDNVFASRELLRIPVNATDCAIHPLVYELLNEGTLVVKSSASSKSICAGNYYAIAKQVDTGFAIQPFYLRSLEEVKKHLADGWNICRRSQAAGGYIDIFTPSDSEYLVEHIDLSMRWRETVAAVVNCEIEKITNWNTGRYFTAALTATVKNTEIVVPADCPFLDSGKVVTAEEFVSAYVTRALESYINAVHAFVDQDADALYVAEPVVTGVDIHRYTDVRAILWKMRDDKEREEREQKIEEGLDC